jgi:hypothetical protein
MAAASALPPSSPSKSRAELERGQSERQRGSAALPVPNQHHGKLELLDLTTPKRGRTRVEGRRQKKNAIFLRFFSQKEETRGGWTKWWLYDGSRPSVVTRIDCVLQSLHLRRPAVIQQPAPQTPNFLYEKIAIIGLLTLWIRSFDISNIAHVILGLQTRDNRFSYYFVYFSIFLIISFVFEY